MAENERARSYFSSFPPASSTFTVGYPFTPCSPQKDACCLQNEQQPSSDTAYFPSLGGFQSSWPLSWHISQLVTPHSDFFTGHVPVLECDTARVDYPQC
jgi:hypothetical protein